MLKALLRPAAPVSTRELKQRHHQAMTLVSYRLLESRLLAGVGCAPHGAEDSLEEVMKERQKMKGVAVGEKLVLGSLS